MPTILLSNPYFIPHLPRFKPIFDHYHLELIIPKVKERLSEEELLAYAGQFDGVICGDDSFNEKVLKACQPRLKVISKWGTGIDSIDRIACNRMSVQVRNTPNAFTQPVADSVVGYILAFSRKLYQMDRAMKSRQWRKITARSLNECVLGVVGVGTIGKAVLRRAHAFGMKLIGNDIVSISPEFLQENAIEMTSLPDLLHRADFVSLNCDLNPTSFHLMNAEKLNMIQPTAVLINTSRGSVVDEKALIAALQAGKIAGAALDVFEVEPLPVDSPLLDMDNVMIAPHNSNSSPAAWENVHWNTIRNLLEGLQMNSEDLNTFRANLVPAS
jgi:D-3-phosphoglycerate dehydrogenase / 2-oxoglutarate reductase